VNLQSAHDPVEPIDSNIRSNLIRNSVTNDCGVNASPTDVLLTNGKEINKSTTDGHVITFEKSIDRSLDVEGGISEKALIAFETDEKEANTKNQEELLSRDEVDIVLGVLKVATKTVKDAMVPMDKVFCLSTDDELDDKLLAIIEAVGYSRIPVYKSTMKAAIVGFILVKNLITYDVRQKPRKTVGKIPLRQPIVVSPKCPLIDILNVFQEGRSHMAIVAEDPHGFMKYTDGMKKKPSNDANSQRRTKFKESYRPIGVITLEDVIEEILQEEIIDENDRTKELIEKRRIGNAKQVLTASYIKKFGHEREFPLIDQVTVDLAIHNYEKQLANVKTPTGLTVAGMEASSTQRVKSPYNDEDQRHVTNFSTPNRRNFDPDTSSNVSIKSPLLNQDSPSYGGMK